MEGVNRAFLHDVTTTMLVSQNNEVAAMLVFQTYPLGVELSSYANAIPINLYKWWPRE